MNLKIDTEENQYLTLDISNLDNGKIGSLPHGSGIDADYSVEEKKDVYIVTNEYHCMNESGYYDGWIPFKLIIPKKNPTDFKLQFTGLNGAGWYRVYKYMLRDYLEELYASCLGELE